MPLLSSTNNVHKFPIPHSTLNLTSATTTRTTSSSSESRPNPLRQTPTRASTQRPPLPPLPSSQAPPTQNTAPVARFRCLYTHDLRRKAKRWQDGYLRFHTFNRRVMVYDDTGNYIGDHHWRDTSTEVQDGDELELDKGGVLVQVGECLERTQTDVSVLWERRNANENGTGSPVKTQIQNLHQIQSQDQSQSSQNAIQQQRNVAESASITMIPMTKDSVLRSAVPQSLSQAPSKSLNELLGIKKMSPIGRSVIPKSPYEQRHSIPPCIDVDTTESYDNNPRSAKRQKQSSEADTITGDGGHIQKLDRKELTVIEFPTESSEKQYRRLGGVEGEQRSSKRQHPNISKDILRTKSTNEPLLNIHESTSQFKILNVSSTRNHEDDSEPNHPRESVSRDERIPLTNITSTKYPDLIVLEDATSFNSAQTKSPDKTPITTHKKRSEERNMISPSLPSCNFVATLPEKDIQPLKRGSRSQPKNTALRNEIPAISIDRIPSSHSSNKTETSNKIAARKSPVNPLRIPIEKPRSKLMYHTIMQSKRAEKELKATPESKHTHDPLPQPRRASLLTNTTAAEMEEVTTRREDKEDNQPTKLDEVIPSTQFDNEFTLGDSTLAIMEEMMNAEISPPVQTKETTGVPSSAKEKRNQVPSPIENKYEKLHKSPAHIDKPMVRSTSDAAVSIHLTAASRPPPSSSPEKRLKTSKRTTDIASLQKSYSDPSALRGMDSDLTRPVSAAISTSSTIKSLTKVLRADRDPLVDCCDQGPWTVEAMDLFDWWPPGRAKPKPS